jgi:hypothetical protein
VRFRPVVAGLGVAVIVSACASSNVDEQRLAVLRREVVATAAAPGTTPWLFHGEAGSGNGIGFGGTSPTVVDVVRRLQGSRSTVTRFYAETAIRSGWVLHSIKCFAASDSFAAAKQFPGWVGDVVVGVGKTFNDADAVSIRLETDYHAQASATLAPTTAVPLTVATLADTCLGAPS